MYLIFYIFRETILTDCLVAQCFYIYDYMFRPYFHAIFRELQMDSLCGHIRRTRLPKL